MNEVIDMAVDWHHSYANYPELKMILDGYLPFQERLWHPFKMKNGATMWITRHEPMVCFMEEPVPPPGNRGGFSRYGGGLGGKIKTPDGEHNAKQCWSSNEGVVNNMHAHRPEVRELLPYPVVDISVYDQTWKGGMAGLFWDLPWVEEQMAKFLPEIGLFTVGLAGAGESSMDATQTAAAAVDLGRDSDYPIWTPFPRATPGRKAGEPLSSKTSVMSRRGKVRDAH
jgi:hypothetical protein